jgi:hypothetical protein
MLPILSDMYKLTLLPKLYAACTVLPELSIKFVLPELS